MATLKFVASDNTPFDTEEEAVAHEAMMECGKQVKAYIDAIGVQGSAAALLSKHLLAFLALTRYGTVPEKEPVKVRKPRAPKAAVA